MDSFSFMENEGKLDVQSFLVLKGIMQILLAKVNYVTTGEFKSEIMKFAFQSRPEVMMLHLNIVIQACFYPTLSKDFTIQLNPLESIRGGDKEYLSAISLFLGSHSKGHNALSVFQRDVSLYVAKCAESQILSARYANRSQEKTSAGSLVVPISATSQGVTFAQSSWPEHRDLQPPPKNMQNAYAPFDSRRENESRSTDGFTVVSKKNFVREKDSRDTGRDTGRITRAYVNDRFESLRTAPKVSLSSVRTISSCLSNFSSAMRKNGMDFILPPALYDKVLCCIYLASSIAVTGERFASTHPERSHKEIVDIIIYLQESRQLGHDESAPLSKTKLRGVLGLLKNASILIVQHDGSEVDSLPKCPSQAVQSSISKPGSADGTIKEVKLIMNERIQSVEDLRRVHDQYIAECVSNFNADLYPEDLKLITWTADEKQQKIARAASFMDSVRMIVKAQLTALHAEGEIDTSSTRARTYSCDEWDELSKQITDSIATSPDKISSSGKLETSCENMPPGLNAFNEVGGSRARLTGPPIVPFSAFQYSEESKDEYLYHSSHSDHPSRALDNAEIEKLTFALMKKQ
jgi:hypothetical protein